MNHSADYTLLLDMPREQAWERLRDLSIPHNYVPGVTRTEITTASSGGVGASRRVYMSDTRYLDETVIEWVDGHGFVIRLHNADAGPPSPFTEATFRYWLEDEGPDQTRLTNTLSYSVRWGVLGKLLNRLVMAGPVRANLRGGALGLKDFYHTGIAITPERLEELKKQAAVAAVV